MPKFYFLINVKNFVANLKLMLSAQAYSLVIMVAVYLLERLRQSYKHKAYDITFPRTGWSLRSGRRYGSRFCSLSTSMLVRCLFSSCLRIFYLFRALEGHQLPEMEKSKMRFDWRNDKNCTTTGHWIKTIWLQMRYWKILDSSSNDTQFRVWLWQKLT